MNQQLAGWKMGAPGFSRCMDPIENGNFRASYVIVYQAGYMERQSFHDLKSNPRIHQLLEDDIGEKSCWEKEVFL